MYDLLIKNGQVILENETKIVNIGIKDGKFAYIGNEEIKAKETINAMGLVVSPGMVDAHVHLSEPGGSVRNLWEGYETGTKAAAKGGVTTIIEMPLNQLPATIDKQSFEIKINAGKGKLAVDVASLGGLVPFNIDKGIAELNEANVVGYKCFMGTCGDRSIKEDFMDVDDFSLYRGMIEIQKTGKPLGIHAENAAITDGLGKMAYEKGEKSLSAYVASRPKFTEVEAIRRAILIGKETNCRLHFCHVSCVEGLEEIIKAKAEGMSITCETCLHYLYFDTSELDSIGAIAKCSPPIRDIENKEKLWKSIMKGDIDLLCSDHSPCTEDLKAKENAFEAWGGISALQNSVDIFYDEAVNKRNMSLNLFAKLISSNPAEIFGLKNKGSIEIGKDADLVFIDPNKSYELKAEDLEYRNKISPYIGRKIGAMVIKTVLKGKVIFDEISGVDDSLIGKFC